MGHMEACQYCMEQGDCRACPHNIYNEVHSSIAGDPDFWRSSKNVIKEKEEKENVDNDGTGNHDRSSGRRSDP